MSPVRIQRQRTKGWRMPEGAIYVGRPSRWGNRVTVAEIRAVGADPVEAFRRWAEWRMSREGGEWTVENGHAWLAPLRGHDLACWCPLDEPCHADVLLALANPVTAS